MRRVTASRAALLSSCAYAFRDGVQWDETTGRAAVQGDEFHKAIAPIVDPTLEAVPFLPTTKWFRTRFEHAVKWLDLNRLESMRAEVAYAYDPATDTARILGYDIGREYEKHGKLPHEIAGSADISDASTPTVIMVRDWKTGRSVTDAVWPQLDWLALFAARAEGKAAASVGPLHVTEFGVADTMRRSLGPDDLTRIATGIRAQVESIEDAWPTPGPWCDGCYCPARGSCSVYQLTKKGAA